MSPGWRDRAATNLTPQEMRRYQRQLELPGVGKNGQAKLKAARVVIAGVGGLGSVSAYYMAAAGVGHLRIVDPDHVSIENLNRQILFEEGDIGCLKTESARNRLRALNPFCEVEMLPVAIGPGNAAEIMTGADLLLDGTDSLEARRELNRASIKLGIPFIFGGVAGFNGMATVFVPGQTPCFECLFRQFADRPLPVGTIGPVPAMVAGAQSLEALKLILGIPGALHGRLMCLSGMDMVIKNIQLEKNTGCKVCDTTR